MKKYIFRAIFNLGFALMTIALKHSMRKDDIQHLEDLEYMIYKIPDLGDAIARNDPVNLLEDNGPDICDFIYVHFPNARRNRQTNHGKMR